MPESGDVEVLNPNVSRGVGVLARRRVGLSLDLSDISSEDIVTKRCKIESMNIQINNGNYPHNGGSGGLFRTILPSDLANRMNKSKGVLVLDCRPFFAYNANHIQGAVNINCSDRFNRRRLLQGKCSLVDLVSSKEGKDLYKKRGSKDIVVVYDDRTKDIKDVATDASMYIVLSVLRREGKQAAILKGNWNDSVLLSHFQLYFNIELPRIITAIGKYFRDINDSIVIRTVSHIAMYNYTR
jgi:rhodanese-related sulfurtransferase